MRSAFFLGKFEETLNKKLTSADCNLDWAPQKEKLLNLLQVAFAGTGKQQISDKDLEEIRKIFYAQLSEWPEAQTTGLLEWSKMIFNNITNYARSALTLQQSLGNHEHYKRVLAQTKQAATYGYKYEDDILIVDQLKVRSMRSGVKRYDEGEIAQIIPVVEYSDTTVRVLEGDTFSVALYLKGQGYNPVILNMACDTKPGGGAEQGYFAQEESLYYRSNYYLGLDRAYNPNGPIYPIPEFSVIYTPDVAVIRDENYQFSSPWYVSIIAAAAYNIAGCKSVDESWYRQGTAKKVEAILKVAAAQRHDCVLLGAFGCGAFRKDENTKVIVSQVFAEVIKNPKFSGVFRNISFAIIGEENFREFSKRLNFDLRSAEFREHQQRHEELLPYLPVPDASEFSEGSLESQVEKVRDLETQLYGQPITPTYNKVSKAWWSEPSNVQGYVQDLQEQLKLK